VVPFAGTKISCASSHPSLSASHGAVIAPIMPSGPALVPFRKNEFGMFWPVNHPHRSRLPGGQFAGLLIQPMASCCDVQAVSITRPRRLSVCMAPPLRQLSRMMSVQLFVARSPWLSVWLSW